MRQSRSKILPPLAALALFACASNDEQQTEVQNITEAYETAKKSIENRNYRKGIQIFEAIQARYPFSDLARQIQIELMYAYYKSGRREEAVEAADTFMREAQRGFRGAVELEHLVDPEPARRFGFKHRNAKKYSDQ